MNKIILRQEPTIIKTKKYSTIDFSLIYPIKYNKKYIYYPDILKKLLTTTCFDYPTEKEFSLEITKRLIIRYRVISRSFLNNIYLEFCFTVPDPKKIEYDIKSAISLIMNSLFKPNICDNTLKRECDYLFKKYNELKVDNYNKIFRDFSKSVNSRLYNKYSYIANLNNLKNITLSSICEYYKKNILENYPILYVYGNINSRELKKLLSPFIEENIKPIKLKKGNYSFFNPRKSTQFIEKKYKISNNSLFLAYLKEDMTQKDLINFCFLRDIFKLNCGISPLFKKLRIENNLVYGVDINLNKYFGILYIETSFDISKKDQILILINECFQELKKKEEILKYQSLVIKKIKDELLRENDYKYAILSNKIVEDLKIDYLKSEYLKIYKNLDIDSFIKFLDELKLDTVYLARGVLDERSKNN